MKNILTFSVIFILFGYINCNCLLRDVSHKCLINENLADEKWLQDICVNNKSVISKLSIVGVLKNELKSYRTFDDYCKIGAIGRFSWINYTKIIEPLLNSAGVDMDLARVSRVTKNKVTYLQNAEHLLDEGLVTEILVENLPLRYELRNIQRTPWENVTKYETVDLLDIYLRNDEGKSQIMTRNPLIVRNHSIEHVFPETLARGTELRLYEEDKITRIVVGQPRPLQEVRENIRISKRVSPNSHMSVRVEGTLANIWFEITGDLTLVYEDFKEERKIKGQVVENKMVDIVQIPTPVSKIAVLFDDGRNHVEDPGARYRTFNIIAIIACIIFFGTAIIVWQDVIRKILHMRREKKKAMEHYHPIHHEGLATN